MSEVSQPNEFIETIEKALEAATPGPWIAQSHISGAHVQSHGQQIALCGDFSFGFRQCMNNANLIAKATEWLRALLEENKRLNKRLETMAEKAAESFEIAVESASELEQVKAERDMERLWRERVQTDYHKLAAELSAKDKVLEWYANGAYCYVPNDFNNEIGEKAYTILSQYKGDTHD